MVSGIVVIGGPTVGATVFFVVAVTVTAGGTVGAFAVVPGALDVVVVPTRLASAGGVSRSDFKISRCTSLRARAVVVGPDFVVTVGFVVGASFDVGAFGPTGPAGTGAFPPPVDEPAPDATAPTGVFVDDGFCVDGCWVDGFCVDGFWVDGFWVEDASESTDDGRVSCTATSSGSLSTSGSSATESGVGDVRTAAVDVATTTSPSTSTFGAERRRTFGRNTSSTASARRRRIPSNLRRSDPNDFTSEAWHSFRQFFTIDHLVWPCGHVR